MICIIMQLFTNKKQSNFLHVNFFENTFLKAVIKVVRLLWKVFIFAAKVADMWYVSIDSSKVFYFGSTKTYKTSFANKTH